LKFGAFEWIWEKKRVQNRVENVGKGKEEGRTLKGYFGHVSKCAIFYSPPTLLTAALPSFCRFFFLLDFVNSPVVCMI